jgi:GH15 family glucan-1,4-alpha-glucosidase
MSVVRATGRMLRDPLTRRSLQVLEDGQARSGAFVASPNFPVYRYAWLRDGAFCAVALDAAGERAAAAAFHRWTARSVLESRSLVESAIERLERGEVPPPEAMPPTRYTLEGAPEPKDGAEAWPNFQLDGYGIWLWSLGVHGGGGIRSDVREAAALVARYLQAGWTLKCFNCWEEDVEGGEHASTRGAIVAGLDAAAHVLGDDDCAQAAADVRADLLRRFVVNGRFRRGPADDRVDGSLLWLGVPFGVVPPTEPLVQETVAAVRRDLAPNGGVYRYLGDTYYGGGEWLLLASSLAWHAAVTGDASGWELAQAWVRAQADENGDLPEQVYTHAQDPAMIDPWLEQWGRVATPLLWSHAMYVIAEAAAVAA